LVFRNNKVTLFENLISDRVKAWKKDIKVKSENKKVSDPFDKYIIKKWFLLFELNKSLIII